MGAETDREVRRRYEADATTALPTWTDLDLVESADAADEPTLTATYYDTPDLRLARAGITLRRGTGDDDAWHLDHPDRAGDRLQLSTPCGPDSEAGAVPDELAEVVQGRLRGHSCAPIATVRTRRTAHLLRGRDGQLLAEVRDDVVAADLHEQDGSISTHSWREWEVAGAEAPGELAGDLEDALIAAAARRASWPSPLARALGPRLPRPSDLTEPRPAADGPAAVVLLVHLRAQVAELLDRDAQVRAGQPGAVHKMRVATRRLRSALATFGPMFTYEVASLGQELKWLGRGLGAARDPEVMRDRLAGLATGEPIELDSTAVAHELEDRIQRRYDEGLAHVRKLLSSPRYFRLLDALDALAEAPPWTEKAALPAGKTLRKLADREWKRFDARAERAARPDSPEDRDALLHEVRKSAKRLRYACEAVTPVLGARAARLAEAAEGLQETLGEHQDSVASQQLLRDLASHTTLAGEQALIYGRLHLLEQTHAEQARAQYPSDVERVRTLRPKRWPKA